MKFGVFDHMDREQDDLSLQYAERLRLIEAYDRGGLYAYHLAEHHGTPLGLAPSPSVFLAAAAQHSERLRLGALVYTLPQYHPLRLAEELCMLDHLSRGRVEFGIGRGISPIELGFYGLSGEEAADRFGECRDVVLAALTSDRLDFHGTYYDFDDVPMVLRPFQQPHPPLWYGVSKTSTCAWAAANDVNVATNGPPAAVRTITDAYRAEWAKLGKAEAALPLLGVNRHIVIADSDEEAFEIARVAYPAWLGSLLLLWRERGVDPGIRFPADAAEAIEGRFMFAGTATSVRESIAELVGATGINYLLCRFAFGSMPFEASLRSVALFIDEVLPAFE
jgi:alkanesulfonate monooxygenase SsuD/methylene tetrahydromethanopterin reductase-like flavin-dependent oxidoreductase (luciferase family)